MDPPARLTTHNLAPFTVHIFHPAGYPGISVHSIEQKNESKNKKTLFII
jgi:hypothetical protein